MFACSPGGILSGVPADLPSEDFTGKVWMLYPPDDFLALCEQINQFDEKNPAGALLSESFGDYSYSRGTSGNGGVTTWSEAFADQLAMYRRMFSEVKV